MSDVTIIKELAKEISVLYVEDDLDLRENTLLLLGKFFDKIDVAKDGQEGVEMYQKNPYDLVISDINMPRMDGIEMSQSIKKIREEQYILITSAHDESKHLMRLIDTGIDQFILKPLEVEKFLKSIYRAVKTISDDKLLKSYSELLEKSNIELVEKNHELEKLNKILKIKIVNQKEPAPVQIDEKKSEKGEDKPLPDENYMEYILPSDIEELSDLEEEIESAISLMILNNRFETEKVEVFYQKLEKMSSLLYGYPIFMELSVNIRNLAAALAGMVMEDEEVFKKMSIFLESFIYVLSKWKEDVLIKGVKNPNIYDSSLINDMQMMCDRIAGVENDGGDMELF